METAACCGTHPPRSADLTEARRLAERLIDALLDSTDGSEWNEELNAVWETCGMGNAGLVGLALRAEALSRLEHLAETACPSGARL